MINNNTDVVYRDYVVVVVPVAVINVGVAVAVVIGTDVSEI